MSIAGGSSQSLCDAPPVILGGSWSREGVILFGSNIGPIMRVSIASRINDLPGFLAIDNIAVLHVNCVMKTSPHSVSRQPIYVVADRAGAARCSQA